MVKSGGTKTKAKMEKITNRNYLATAFTKRTYGLHSKASELCFLTGAQIAILATPPSGQSNVSFYSFGHSSVDSLVSAYLSGQRPAPVREETREEDIGICMARKELGLEMWWESLFKSTNPQELKDAIDSISRMLNELRSGGSALGSTTVSDSQQGACQFTADLGTSSESLAYNDVSTNPNPFISSDSQGGVEDEALMFHNKGLDEDYMSFEALKDFFDL